MVAIIKDMKSKRQKIREGVAKRFEALSRPKQIYMGKKIIKEKSNGKD